MSEILKYKGYLGEVKLDAKHNVLSGQVIDLNDVITFHGETPQEVVQAFHESVDTYLAFCKEVGKAPEKTYSGALPFRTTREIHSSIAKAARIENLSINAWMEKILSEAAERTMQEYSIEERTVPSLEEYAKHERSVGSSTLQLQALVREVLSRMSSREILAPIYAQASESLATLNDTTAAADILATVTTAQETLATVAAAQETLVTAAAAQTDILAQIFSSGQSRGEGVVTVGSPIQESKDEALRTTQDEPSRVHVSTAEVGH